MSDDVISVRSSDDERADVLAYLRRRHANAAAVAKTAQGRDFGSEMDVLAQDRRRQLEVMIAELEAGFHHSEAELAAFLTDAVIGEKNNG